MDKQTVGQLAVLGGPPAFDAPLHVGRPNIGDRTRFLERVNDILDRRWLTNDGPYVRELEQRIADYLGVRHCVTVCNATVGLELAIRAADLTGEVIVPSFTFVATAHALQWQQIAPVFCDVDPRTCNLDPERVEGLLTPRTTGIIGVHLWGRPCDPGRLEELCRHHGLALLFDAAHAFGCTHAGRMIGGFGAAEVFSFHATKFCNAFEGGAVTTNDDDLAEKMRLMRNFGFAGYDNVVYVGTNGKMTEVCAAMGLTSLESIDTFIAANRANYHHYRALLAAVPGVSVLPYDETERCNYQYLIVQIDPATAGLTRDQIMDVLHAENVLARRYFWPGCHAMEPYRSLFPLAHFVLPVTKDVAGRVLALPTGSAVGAAEVETICRIIRLAVEHAGAVRGHLPVRAVAHPFPPPAVRRRAG